jgi:hypothetical protein
MLFPYSTTLSNLLTSRRFYQTTYITTASHLATRQCAYSTSRRGTAMSQYIRLYEDARAWLG